MDHCEWSAVQWVPYPLCGATYVGGCPRGSQRKLHCGEEVLRHSFSVLQHGAVAHSHFMKRVSMRGGAGRVADDEWAEVAALAQLVKGELHFLHAAMECVLTEHRGSVCFV
jgi:hypothetical protein